MKKAFVAAFALAIAFVIAPAFAPHATVAQEPPLPATWPQTTTFTGATPAPFVINVGGYKWCSITASTGAVFSSTTLTASDSNDNGTTYEPVSGSSNLGATPAPASTITAVGKLTFPVQAHLLFELVASGGGGSTNIPVSAYCTT